jgi:hypothetical protein
MAKISSLEIKKAMASLGERFAGTLKQPLDKPTAATNGSSNGPCEVGGKAKRGTSSGMAESSKENKPPTESDHSDSKPAQQTKPKAEPPRPELKETRNADVPKPMAKVASDETVLSVGAKRGHYPLIGIRRPGRALENVVVETVGHDYIQGVLMGAQGRIEVTISRRGVNFGRDHAGRNIQYQYRVTIRNTAFLCVSRIPLILATRCKVPGEEVMRFCRPQIWRDYTRLVDTYGKPSQDPWW